MSSEVISASKPLNLLIGVTGSVATIKLLPLIDAIKVKFDSTRFRLSVRVMTTERAKHFFDASSLGELRPPIRLYQDADEWSAWNQIGDQVLHIELRNWADMLLIAPLDANTLAKLANGLCDNLLTCVARAWKVTNPVLIAPAMNTAMWDHPHTSDHLQCCVQKLRYHVVPVISKRLACGDVGFGAMAEPCTIAQQLWDQALIWSGN
jgi:phosphopantothenoylcysteine decarboxylase